MVPLTQQLMALYGGAFLSGNHEVHWAAPLRNKLRKELLRQLGAAADFMLQSGLHSEAAAARQRVLEIDTWH